MNSSDEAFWRGRARRSRAGRLALAATATALGAFAVPGAAGADDLDPTEEVVVWGDLFARWDDTRWMITTEVALPYEITLARDENQEFDTREVALKTVIGCNKDWRLNKRRYEVGCVIEDFAMQAAVSERRVTEQDIERAQAVLDEIDAKLSGAKLQLQVADDGRVTNLDLEGVPRQNRRQSDIQETLRQILSRVVVGFNLKLQKYNQLHEGKWYEYNSSILSVPGASSTAAMGSNLVVHYLNPFQGHIIVQSIGKGMVSVDGAPVANSAVQKMDIALELIGVSTFDKAQGYMLERVWAINGSTTAASMFVSQPYYNAGRIWTLGELDKPDCGPTRVVNGRKQRVAGLPSWEPIER
jgi:hypothetical protein